MCVCVCFGVWACIYIFIDMHEQYFKSSAIVDAAFD